MVMNKTIYLTLLILALWKWLNVVSAPLVIISTTNFSNYYSSEPQTFDAYKKDAVSIASQPIFTWDLNYTIASEQSSNMTPEIPTECITEASIEMSITSSTNWPSTNYNEGIGGKSSSTSESLIASPLCRLNPAFIPSPAPTSVTFSVIFFSCWAIGAVVLSIAATCVIRCRLRRRAKNIQISNETTQEVRYQTPTLEHYEAEISISIDA